MQHSPTLRQSSSNTNIRYPYSKSMDCENVLLSNTTQAIKRHAQAKILRKEATYHTAGVVHTIQIYLCHKSNVWG